MLGYQSVSLRDFYAEAVRDILVPRAPNLFLPDGWTKVFARALRSVSWGGKNALEVGVGTGINMAGLLSLPIPPKGFIGTDISSDAIWASRILANTENWGVELLPSDLLGDVPDVLLQRVDHIFACIPQVPAAIDLTEGDNSAHYYNPTGTYWDEYGLGLNARLLQQATERAPQAAVTLNLSGRPGIGRLRDFFRQHGRDCTVLHEEIVPQHSETSLTSLASMEGNGHGSFEFFADEHGIEEIPASAAEERRSAHQPVFHKIYVITAAPVTP